MSASIEAGQKLSIMISKPDGLVSYEGPQGKISVGCKIGKNPNVMYEPASGIYSLILDEDGDGFPESAVNRNTGARVKFSIETKE